MYLRAGSDHLYGSSNLKPGEQKSVPKVGIRDLLAAWHFVRSQKRLTVILSKIPPMIANSRGWLLINIVAVARLPALDAGLALGVMHAVRALGSGVGPLLPDKLLPRNTLSGPVLTFVGVALFTWFDMPALFMLGLFLWGAGSGHNWVVTTAKLQAFAPQTLIGRVTALDFSMLSISETIIILVAAIIMDKTGLPSLGVLCTLILAVVPLGIAGTCL